MGSGNSIYKCPDDEKDMLANVYRNLVVQSNQPSVTIDSSRKTWKTIRVFVSSTFADFFAEREILVKVIFPRLRSWCEQYKLTIVEVDLRWGVPADSTAEEILRACLEEIDRCRENNEYPFFINMLSHRYGWTPKMDTVPESVINQYSWVNGASVTLMEILHGAVRDFNPNALFLIRDPLFQYSIEAQFKEQFIDNSWYSKSSLDCIKYRLMELFGSTNQVIEYSVTPCGVDNSAGIPKQLFDNLTKFGDSIFDFLTMAIRRQYPLACGGDSLSLIENLSAPHESFAKQLTNVIIGRDIELARSLKLNFLKCK